MAQAPRKRSAKARWRRDTRVRPSVTFMRIVHALIGQSERPHYALHPGYVRGHEGERHYITAARLAELYGLASGSWIRWDMRDPSTYAGRDPRDYTHLYPHTNGRYRRPE